MLTLSFDYARKTKQGVDDEKTNRLDGFIGYKYNKFKVEYDYTQMYSDAIKYDNKKCNYEHNVAFLSTQQYFHTLY